MIGLIGFIRPGMGELLVILAIVLVFFGAKRLPEMGASIGQAIKGFRKSMKDLDDDSGKEKPDANKQIPPQA